MPGKVKVRVVAGRGLPVMDRSTDLTDAYVEIRFGPDVFKTDICKKSLNPQWNSEWFKFEVEDESLQDEPLELRVLDHDTYSANDAIGKIYVDLNPLLTKETPKVISGWFPIYDTMHGIRGELNIIVKVDLFSDVNKFRQSSCGIQFFSTAEVPAGYRMQIINGFVEELVVNDDPEYQWIDKIRTPRASNEARQRLFSKLSGELQRKIGVKVSELGGNAVIGYCQCFDLEGESGIVARGIGTGVTLVRPSQAMPPSPLGVSPQYKDLRHAVNSHFYFNHLQTPPTFVPSLISRSHHHLTMTPPHTPVKRVVSISPPPSAPPLVSTQSAFSFPFSSPLPEDSAMPSSPPSMLIRCATSPVKVTSPQAQVRRSSDSDVSSTTPPKGSSLTESSGSGSGVGCSGKTMPKLSAQQPSIELMEYPFFTMTSFPFGFIVHLGGVVSAKSVKLLDKIHNPEEPETRDAWWTEIRTEIRTHCRSMGCHAVLGYTEKTTICDEIIVLCATGTAARVNIAYDPMTSARGPPLTPAVVLEKQPMEKERDRKLYVDVNLANSAAQSSLQALYDHSSDDGSPQYNCMLCHVPYKPNSAPFPVSLSVCAICRKQKVPDVLFTTIDPPPEIQTHGKGSFIQARVCRAKSKSKGGESNAREISDCLPFLEYELHSQLMNKLRLCGMNGLYGLKIQITVGELLLVGVASATGVFIAALPAPPILRVSGQATTEEENNRLQEIQKRISERVMKNREKHELLHIDTGQISPRSVVTDDSDDDTSDLDLSTGNKETFVIEVDDANDENIVALLKESQLPEGFTMLNTHKIPGSTSLASNLQMFTQVWKQDYVSTSKSSFMDIFENLVKKICYKLRRMSPCCLCGIDFRVDLPEDREIQITLTGVCCSLENVADSAFEPQTYNKENLLKTVCGVTTGNSGASERDDMMFPMEEFSSEGPMANLQGHTKAPPNRQTKVDNSVRRSLEHVHSVQKHKNWVELTPLPYIPGFKIERYLGNYNFFFIRESTSLREVGGQGGFMQTFVAEVMANVRANVASLGGNGMVSYQMNQCVLMCNPHKNQSQCLINVSGDAVVVSSEESFPIVVETLRKNSDSPST
ncbi:C2 domain-containing protein 5-like isoform X2 [Ostrea edulis]|uniref:C2 domain-containing protein 5-like isoform X2 n=1 Tax=Ostrea edulis TaxID=37623 RepID=UPI002094F0AB|nr:C2 domain-containing protein 5-like isoform X2 [Ostrea edulis]